MCGDDDKVRTGLLPGKKQVYIVVAGDLVHQRILKDRETVAKTDDDIAPEVFPCLQKEAVGPFGGMLRRQLRKDAVDLVDAFIGEDLIDVSEAALLQRKKIAAGILQIADIVDKCHQEVQFRTAPEVIRLLGAGGILNDGVGHGGYKVRICFQSRKAVPTVRVRHIEEIDRLDIEAMLPKIRRKVFKEFAFGVGHDNGFRVSAAASLRAAHEEGNDKASGLIGAGCADAEDVIVFPRLHAVRHVGGVFFRIIRPRLNASKEHSGNFFGAAQLQMLSKLLFCRKSGGAVSAVRQDIKAAGVPGKFVA